jgi:transposase
MYAPPALFPASSAVTVRTCASTGGALCFFVESNSSTASCPLCEQPSYSVHSRYIRKPADLPCHDQRVAIRLQVRRFRCFTPHCVRRIFAERFSFVGAFARSCRRLQNVHARIGLAVGGEAGSRLSRHLAMPTSPDTVLRRIRQLPLPASSPVRVLGVDDWAFRRGHNYGTILCDLERRRVIELLPERSAESLARWLNNHPEVEIISRDRGDDYIKGASLGAPQAVQVADRWHLLRNLSDAVRGIVDRLAGKIRRVVETIPRDGPVAEPPAMSTEGAVNCQSLPVESPEPTRYRRLQQERRQRRIDQYRQVRELHQQGVSFRAIGRRLGINRATARRLAQAESFPERAARLIPRRTDALTDYLRSRWDAGCRNAAQLFAELKAKGENVSYHMVRRRLARWHQRTALSAAGPGAPPPCRPRFSPRRMVRLLLKPKAEMTEDERALYERLEQEESTLARTAELGRQFRVMIRERRRDALPEWLARSQAPTAPPEIRGFAKGIREDERAVQAALHHEWSNGQVEGQVNRIKTLKRQMFGRANFDLLRRRVLLAS